MINNGMKFVTCIYSSEYERKYQEQRLTTYNNNNNILYCTKLHIYRFKLQYVYVCDYQV